MCSIVQCTFLNEIISLLKIINILKKNENYNVKMEDVDTTEHFIYDNTMYDKKILIYS